MTLEDVYALVGVQDIKALNNAYVREDQRLFKSGEWDYDNPELLTNRIKKALEEVDPRPLPLYERSWRREILWFWYHHAISCAIWRYKDREMAKVYAAEAIVCQGRNHPNQITRLLFLLVNDRVEEARAWAAQIGDSVEQKTADELFLDYVSGRFF